MGRHGFCLQPSFLPELTLVGRIIDCEKEKVRPLMDAIEAVRTSESVSPLITFLKNHAVGISLIEHATTVAKSREGEAKVEDDLQICKQTLLKVGKSCSFSADDGILDEVRYARQVTATVTDKKTHITSCIETTSRHARTAVT